MGASACKGAHPKSAASARFRTILDQYETLEDVQEGLRKSGLEASKLILGIDFTYSNEWSGRHSFSGENLHSLHENKLNPYEQAMTIIANTLGAFDDDNLIPCYGFGDTTTEDRAIFSFYQDDRPVNGLAGVSLRYRQIAPLIDLAGPTSFAPLIKRAMRAVVQSQMQYHILVIIADGQVTPECMKETVSTIVKASNLPLSIIMIGVGDGPWDQMVAFDDQLPKRKFDNFQFVNFGRVMKEASVYGDNLAKIEAHFAVQALMEIPEQFSMIQKLGLMMRGRRKFRVSSDPVVYPPPPRVAEADMRAH